LGFTLAAWALPLWFALSSHGLGFATASGPGSVGIQNGNVVRRPCMALDIMSPTQPRMLLWGQLTRIKARWMWRLRLRKFVKFGRDAMVGGFDPYW
jgi:hypothetical protein